MHTVFCYNIIIRKVTKNHNNKILDNCYGLWVMRYLKANHLPVPVLVTVLVTVVAEVPGSGNRR